MYVKLFTLQKPGVLCTKGRVVLGNMSAQGSGLPFSRDQHTTSYLEQHGGLADTQETSLFNPEARNTPLPLLSFVFFLFTRGKIISLFTP